MGNEKGFYRYKVLFSAEVTHTYYANGICKDLIVNPTSYTREVLKGMLLEFRTTATGFMVLYDETRLSALLNYIAVNSAWTSLSFVLTTTDPYFLNFSELPMDLLDRTLYLSNTYAHRDIESNEKILLHPGRYEKGAQSMPVVTGQIKVQLPDERKKYILEILDLSGNAVLSIETQAFKGISSVYIDLSPIPEGRYTLKVSDVGPDTADHRKGGGKVQPRAGKAGTIIKEEAFVYIALNRPALGFFTIFPADPANENPVYFPVQGTTVATKHYLVRFENRATFWRYFLVFPDQREVGDIFIKNPENQFRFDGPQEVSIGDGVKAWRFISREAIPLKEISPYKFRLLENKIGEIREELISRLPVAGPGQVLPEEGRIFSPLYVNV